MATASDIAAVRENANEPADTSTYTDETIGTLVDLLGVAGASARVWRLKAGVYAELVTTKEGSTSENFSDLHKQALAMATDYDNQALPVEVEGRVKVKKIVRS